MPLRRSAGFISSSYNPLQVPDAPTGVSASAGYAEATVTFTAPTNVGGSAITGYIAVAVKTSDKSTIAVSGSSSPITITGLTNGSAYTINVSAVNIYGPSSVATSGSVTPTGPTVIGQAFGGGFYAGQISTTGNGVATHYLIVAPRSSGENSNKTWKTSRTSTTGTDSVIDGPTNSANMNNASHPAAEFCEGLSIGGYTDWYMPAQNELEVCYYNLKPTTTSNNTSSGINTNAVPSRGSAYTAGTPAQTSATSFISGNSEAFASSGYWSSTQTAAAYALLQTFTSGLQDWSFKDQAFYVRAVRRMAV